MADGAKMEITGFDELNRILDKLPEKVANVVQKKAVRAGSTPVLKEYRRNVRAIGVVSGRFRVSPARKIKMYPRTSTAVAIVGPRSRDAPHAGFIEFGTVGRRHKNGKWVGRMPALAPLRRAWEATRETAKQRVIAVLHEGVIEEAKKLRGHQR